MDPGSQTAYSGPPTKELSAPFWEASNGRSQSYSCQLRIAVSFLFTTFHPIS
jgi:hypothetical protein